MPVNTSIDNLKNHPAKWALRLQNYFAGNLGDFYAKAVNRLTLYPVIFTFFLVECTTFWLIYLGKSFFFNYMSFVMIYSLHKAAVYSFCIYAADTVTHHLAAPWGVFDRRSVGKQWLIWTSGLLVGFVMQRTMVSGLIIHYAPEVISYFAVRPEIRLSHFELLLYLIPYWCFVMLVTIRIALSKQRIQEKAGPDMAQPEEQKEPPAKTRLTLANENGVMPISLADITHITIEDHYCRINYSVDGVFKNIMVRLPLKEMLLKLPREQFVQIHRSHVVNTSHVSRLKKRGRDHRVEIEKTGVELPVSRSHIKALSLRLSGF